MHSTAQGQKPESSDGHQVSSVARIRMLGGQNVTNTNKSPGPRARRLHGNCKTYKDSFSPSHVSEKQLCFPHKLYMKVLTAR